MSDRTQTCRGDGTRPTPARDMRDPLAFLAQDHMRARQVCAALDRLAEGDGAGTGDAPANAEAGAETQAGSILAFLGTEYRDHVADEEQTLYPMLLSRCLSEDEIWKAIDRVSEDRGRCAAALPALAALLRGIEAGAPLADEGRAALRGFAAQARRFLIAENAIILPLARARLSLDDLTGLRAAMCARRSWPVPDTPPPVPAAAPGSCERQVQDA